MFTGRRKVPVIGLMLLIVTAAIGAIYGWLNTWQHDVDWLLESEELQLIERGTVHVYKDEELKVFLGIPEPKPYKIHYWMMTSGRSNWGVLLVGENRYLLKEREVKARPGRTRLLSVYRGWRTLTFIAKGKSALTPDGENTITPP